MNKYDYRSNIKKYDLEVANSMTTATNEQIAACYNGCGAEWMPNWSRDVIDQFVTLYKDCVVVHDWDFSHSDGTKENFNLANKRMLKNMKKIRDYHFPWSNPKHYFTCFKWYLKARVLYRTLNKFGFKAWQEAYDKKAFDNILD
ncbi:hypothetical protein LJT99_05390 [Lentisphaerae bacterium WC36]|nr:hypothetical protein LJT99_05390 [Lentisphaerae bacterium WC36]